MNRKPTYSQQQAQAELLDALLRSEDAFYPWDPTEPETEAYFDQLEGLDLEDWSVEEFESASQAFFAQVDQCWGVKETELEDSLSKRFAATGVPHAWIEAIAHRAQQVVSTNLSVADQLVQCVQQLLPDWGPDDLQVFARPLAFAMRGITDEAVESSLVGQASDWTELSKMEQARLSLAVASYALAQLKDTTESKE